VQVNSWNAANSVPDRGFRVHLCEMLAGWVQVNRWTSANAVRVKGFRLNQCELLAGCR